MMRIHDLPDADFRRTIFVFGQRGLIVFLALLNAFVPLSIDLYLPALPSMTSVFGSSEATAKLTLSLFILGFAVSMLFWGPLSDRYGRKPILTAGLILYILGGFICAIAPSMAVLIAGRSLQGVGCGGIQAVSMAIVKDTCRGKVMESVLAWIQTMTVVCPMAAPILGAWLLKFTPWQGLFWILLGFAVVALMISLALRETLRDPLDTAAWRTLARIPHVLRHKGLAALLLIFSLSSMPFMAYLASSSFIYVNTFGASPEAYSYYFAASAGVTVGAPFAYMLFLRRLPRVFFLGMCFAFMTLSGILLLLWGQTGPLLFTILFVPISFFGTACRPSSTTLTMSQLDSDNGTAASLMGSCGLLFGGLSMLLCSLDWPDLIVAVGVICTVTGLLCLRLWLAASHFKLYREHS